jgi:adenine-specific DNA-methyltransferase
MGKPRKRLVGAEQTRATSLIDPSVALELSTSIANENRLGFARCFTAAIATAYRHTVHDGPAFGALSAAGLDGIKLIPAALEAARQIAAGIGPLPPGEVAYAIGTLYAALLPERFRAQHGIFYTPPALVECLLAMVDESGIDWQTARVLDPACGGGVFLIAVAERMVRALRGAEPAIVLQSIGARLRGFDIDPFGAWLARAMLGTALHRLAGSGRRGAPDLVDTRDSLELRSEDAERFDLVIGNPPYGRVTLPPIRCRRFGKSVYGHANLYGVFTDAALQWVRHGGVIGYVTPTSMLSRLYYRALRTLLAVEAPPLAVSFVSKRKGVFADVLQETMLATYRKGGLPVAGIVGFVDVSKDNEVLSRKAGSLTLPTAPHSPWLLPRSANPASLAKRLRSMPGSPTTAMAFQRAHLFGTDIRTGFR